MEGAGEVKGAGPWEHMVTKDFGSFTYEAWRRTLPVQPCAAPPSVATQRLHQKQCLELKRG